MTTALTLRRGLGLAVRQALYTVAAHRRVKDIRILAYHSVDDSGSTLSVRPPELRQHLTLLRDEGWRALSVSQYLQRLNGSPGGGREVLLTFDDGYENFYHQAAPLLIEFGFPATVFVPTDFIGERPEWFRRDRSEIARFLETFRFTSKEIELVDNMVVAAADRRLMNARQIKELLRAGLDFQSHSAGHHFLPTLSDEALLQDLIRSRRCMADLLGIESYLLCYPYGATNRRIADIASRAGFRAAFSATYAGPHSDPFDIGRIGIAGDLGSFHLRFCLSAAIDHYVKLKHSFAPSPK